MMICMSDLRLFSFLHLVLHWRSGAGMDRPDAVLSDCTSLQEAFSILYFAQMREARRCLFLPHLSGGIANKQPRG
jgi:hypothetical protein